MKKVIFTLIASLFILASCGGNGKSNDIINKNAEYLYFFGATCPHCQELNAKVTAEDLFSKIEVEKREVYFNNANREIFLAVTKELGLKESEVGVPFVYDKVSGEYSIGVEPALELFKSRLNSVVETPEAVVEEVTPVEKTPETENNEEETITTT